MRYLTTSEMNRRISGTLSTAPLHEKIKNETVIKERGITTRLFFPRYAFLYPRPHKWCPRRSEQAIVLAKLEMYNLEFEFEL